MLCSVHSTHPLKLVLLVKTSKGRVGWLGTKNSYTKNARSSTSPRMSGASTCEELQGNCIPPHVNAMRARVVPATTIILPLQLVNETKRNHTAMGTHIISTRENFSLSVPGGVRTRRKNTTSPKANPERGRLMSTLAHKRQVLRHDCDHLQKSHLQVTFSAKDPPYRYESWNILGAEIGLYSQLQDR